jgi:hypothetical protein
MKGSILALAAVLAAAPAGALDTPVGTYLGKTTCRQIVGGVASKTKHEVTLNIAESAAGITFQMTGTAEFAATGTVEAVLAEDAEKTDRGAFNGYSCDTNSPDGNAVYGDVVIKSSGKATIKGTVLRSIDATDDVRICTFSAKRTSVSAPPVVPCVPLP